LATRRSPDRRHERDRLGTLSQATDERFSMDASVTARVREVCEMDEVRY